MQDKHHILMIIGCIFVVAMIYGMVQSRSGSKCGREGFIEGEEPATNTGEASGETTTPDSQLDNYNYFTKNSIPTVYYGPNNATARVTMNGGENDESDSAERTYAITVTNANGTTATYAMELGAGGATMNPITNMVSAQPHVPYPTASPTRGSLTRTETWRSSTSLRTVSMLFRHAR
jgi:hypothetical protein